MRPLGVGEDRRQCRRRCDGGSDGDVTVGETMGEDGNAACAGGPEGEAADRGCERRIELWWGLWTWVRSSARTWARLRTRLAMAFLWESHGRNRRRGWRSHVCRGRGHTAAALRVRRVARDGRQRHLVDAERRSKASGRGRRRTWGGRRHMAVAALKGGQ